MPTEVLMPKLGLTMTKGTMVRWFKSEGESVEKGEKLALFETEKVTTEVAAPASGTLLKIVSPAKSAVPVGQVIAYIGKQGESLPAPPPQAAAPAAPALAPGRPGGAAPARRDDGGARDPEGEAPCGREGDGPRPRQGDRAGGDDHRGRRRGVRSRRRRARPRRVSG